MSNVDIQKLADAVKYFRSSSNPSNGSSDAPCTVGDIRKVVSNTADLFETFLKELAD